VSKDAQELLVHLDRKIG